MRIEEDLKLAGYFWLPCNKDKKIAGTLSIVNGGKVVLEIIGHFSEGLPDFNNLNLGRIIGHVENLTLVTLENCFYINPNYSFGGVSKSKIHVNYALSGIEYEQDEEVAFDSFNFSIDGLEEWVGISGISVECNDDYLGGMVKFQQPAHLSYQLKKGLGLEVMFGHPIVSRNGRNNLNLSHITYLKITSVNALSIDDIIFYLHKFITFFNFAIDSNVSLKSVYCFSNSIASDVNGVNRPDPIGLFYSSMPFEEKTPKIEWHTMLFRYVDIKDRFNEIVDKWLDAYDAISPSLNLYFSTKMGAQKYLDGKFLALAQALETYHRRTSNETYISKEEFKKLIQEIKSKCPESHIDWLATRIDKGNEISLRTRLNRITESFKSNIGTDEQVGLIIKLIVDTRNYLTHYEVTHLYRTH